MMDIEHEFWSNPQAPTSDERINALYWLSRAALYGAVDDLLEEIEQGPPSKLKFDERETADWIANRHKRISVIRRQMLSGSEDNKTCRSESVDAIFAGWYSAIDAVKTQAFCIAAAEQLDDNQQEGDSCES